MRIDIAPATLHNRGAGEGERRRGGKGVVDGLGGEGATGTGGGVARGASSFSLNPVRPESGSWPDGSLLSHVGRSTAPRASWTSSLKEKRKTGTRQP